MHTTRSASCAPRLSRSASDTASTASIPSSKQARMMRTAISPRFATSTRFSGIGSADHDERLPVLDRLAVLGPDRLDLARDRRDHGVHQLHHFDDGQGVALIHGLADLDERRAPGAGGPPAEAAAWAFDDRAFR